MFQTSPPCCCGHWPKITWTWSYLTLNSNLEKFLPLRGEEKTTYCHHTVLQVRQESGCSVYCYGIRLSEVTQDQWTWGLCWHVLRELPHCIASAPPHNVYIVQFFFPSTERGQTYLKISVLSYHSTYICPSSFGRGENGENLISVTLKL